MTFDCPFFLLFLLFYIVYVACLHSFTLCLRLIPVILSPVSSLAFNSLFSYDFFYFPLFRLFTSVYLLFTLNYLHPITCSLLLPLIFPFSYLSYFSFTSLFAPVHLLFTFNYLHLLTSSLVIPFIFIFSYVISLIFHCLQRLFTLVHPLFISVQLFAHFYFLTLVLCFVFFILFLLFLVLFVI